MYMEIPLLSGKLKNLPFTKTIFKVKKFGSMIKNALNLFNVSIELAREFVKLPNECQSPCGVQQDIVTTK